jgi:hypothetical protein
MELFNRGRVWYGCDPQLPVANLSRIEVTVDKPSPHEIKPDLIVYVFDYEEGEKPVAVPGAADAFATDAEKEAVPQYPEIKKARFLGEFMVAQAGGKAVVLKPTVDLTLPQHQQMLQRLQAAQGPWMIREAMPTDPHHLYADLSEEELRAFIPAEMVKEYQADGDKDRKFQDYLAFMKWYNKVRTEQIETEETLLRYNKDLDESIQKSQNQEVVAKALNDELLQKLAVIESERDKVVEHEQKLKNELAKVTKELNDLMEKNRVLAQTITQFQEEAFQRINGQTASAQ